MLTFLHRSGNMHDANGTRESILSCVEQIQSALPGVVLEVRMDSAFLSDEIVLALTQRAIQYQRSV
jgi:hypothetical protein